MSGHCKEPRTSDEKWARHLVMSLYLIVSVLHTWWFLSLSPLFFFSLSLIWWFLRSFIVLIFTIWAPTMFCKWCRETKRYLRSNSLWPKWSKVEIDGGKHGSGKERQISKGWRGRWAEFSEQQGFPVKEMTLAIILATDHVLVGLSTASPKNPTQTSSKNKNK